MSECQVKLEPMYETDEGLEFIVNPDDYTAIQKQMDLGKFRMAFHFQTVDCACVYGVTNKDTWVFDIEVYKYLKKYPYTRRTLLQLLKAGHFDIGVTRLGNYHVITDITPYDVDENSEIRLHYTYPRSYAGNVAWRSMNWDLFKENVDEMNKEAMENDASAAEQRRVYLRMSEV
jgi:hypothetical protein